MSLLSLTSNLRSLPTVLILAMASIPASPAQPSELEESAPYRVKRLFYGCWTVTTHHHGRSLWPTSSITRCFERGRMMSGVAVDAGDGWDFCERWRVDGRRLAVRDDYGNAESCLYAFSNDRRTLILRDCSAARDWLRDDRMTEITRGSSTCRMQGRANHDEQRED